MDSRYEKGECMYVNPYTNLKVYRGIDLKTNQSIVIKEVVTYEANIANKLLRESWIQSSINHPNICKLFGQYFFKDGERFTCGIAMEQLPSDLQAEIDGCRRRNEHIPEETLWIYLEQLISALALAQEKCICHRDIKPLNLFTGPDHMIKIGDLGAAKTHIRLTNLQTLEGSPSYLSPKVRQQHYDNQLTRTNAKVMHNPYKSDVFSLGMTCIAACMWEIPEELFALDRLQEKIEKVVQHLPGYSHRLKEFVALMVIVDEDQRPDFLSLRRSSLISASPVISVFRNMPESAVAGLCLNCNNPPREGFTVQLTCSPLHFCCSEVCFKSFISRETKGYFLGLEAAKCPICDVGVDGKLVERVYGEEFPPIPIGLERCSYCKSAVQPLDICRCRHRFCLNCLKTLKKVHGKVPKECPEDHTPFDADNLKKHRAICRVF